MTYSDHLAKLNGRSGTQKQSIIFKLLNITKPQLGIITSSLLLNPVVRTPLILAHFVPPLGTNLIFTTVAPSIGLNPILEIRYLINTC